MAEKEEKRKTGHIYSIRSHQTDLIYIGSTFQALNKRLHQHKDKSGRTAAEPPPSNGQAENVHVEGLVNNLSNID